MGIWSENLFANDLTCDVRDTYIRFLEQQLSNEIAYRKTYDKYCTLIGTEEEQLFWYAIADTQWNVGRLMPEIKRKVVDLINNDTGAVFKEDSDKHILKWKETLLNLKNKLESPMPPEKRIKKPIEFIHNPWNVGDVYAYMFHSSIAVERGVYGKYILFQKIGDIEWYDNITLSIVQVYNKVFDFFPEISVIHDIPLLPLVSSDIINLKLAESEDDYKKYFNRFFKAIMNYSKKRNYPKKYFTFVGNSFVKNIKYDYTQCTELDWHMNDMDKWLSSFYLEWQSVNY